MPQPRPYGRGPYGTGPYSRYRGQIYLAAGTTGIVFNAKARGLNVIRHAEAITEIRFGVQALSAWTWAAYSPCETGAWQDAPPCEQGAWQAPGLCSPGVWQEMRLP